MHGVGEEALDGALVQVLAAVDRCERLLRQVVVEAGRPLAGAHARGVRAVVHHERDAAGVHVRVQAVHRLDDRLVADLRIRVPLQSASGLGFKRLQTDAELLATSGCRDERLNTRHSQREKSRIQACQEALTCHRGSEVTCAGPGLACHAFL